MTPRVIAAFPRLALMAVLAFTAGGCPTNECEAPECTGTDALLAARFHQQHTQVWCWAAVSSETVDLLRGTFGEDCQWVSAVFNYDCCSNPGPCAITATTQQMQAALHQIAGVESTVLGRPLSECELRAELDAGRPVIAGLQNSFSGHVILIVGYDGTGYTVHDPYFGAFSAVPYASVLQNWQIGQWSQTIAGLGGGGACY